MSDIIAVPQRRAEGQGNDRIMQDSFDLGAAVNDQAPTSVASWDLNPDPAPVTESSKLTVRILRNLRLRNGASEANRSRTIGDGRTEVNARLLLPGAKYRGATANTLPFEILTKEHTRHLQDLWNIRERPSWRCSYRHRMAH